MEKLGSWAFLIGVILAVIFGVVGGGTWLPILLIVLGLVIGLINITDKEVIPFLWAGTVLVIVSAFGGQVFNNIGFMAAILANLLMLFVPATIIVALKSVFSMAKGK